MQLRLSDKLIDGRAQLVNHRLVGGAQTLGFSGLQLVLLDCQAILQLLDVLVLIRIHIIDRRL